MGESSCIDFYVSRSDEGVDFGISRSGDCLDYSIVSCGRLSDFSAARADDCPGYSVSRSGGKMDFRCSLICWVGGDRWLRVTPDEVVWLDESNDWSAEFEVEANVNWTIDINN